MFGHFSILCMKRLNMLVKYVFKGNNKNTNNLTMDIFIVFYCYVEQLLTQCDSIQQPLVQC